jgi:hypothetical protein
MEPISTIIITALGYILQGAAESKTAEKAKDELLDGYWQWIRPHFFEDVPEVATKPDDPEVQAKAEDKLTALIEDEAFFQELVKRVAELQKAGIREKNIVRKDIARVKKIKIGDKVYDFNDTYDRKNIVEGNVADADEFVLGDGH